jgi:peptide deformylase
MLKLIKAPNPILTSPAKDWQFLSQQDYDDAVRVESEMLQLMKESNGIGLAANQVGILSRVFVIQLQAGQAFAMFNPTVVAASDEEQVGREGCLSFPDLWLEVPRPKQVVSLYLDKTGKECTITLSDIDARCFLHELDHLNGICFTEKTSALKLALAKKRQQKKRKFI